ncbi:hypothetical protein ACIOKD_01630 [Streptomyces sp. NPDC087844]
MGALREGRGPDNPGDGLAVTLELMLYEDVLVVLNGGDIVSLLPQSGD